MKVEIGSKYEGPEFDRPALRQMPRHWHLEEENPPTRRPLSPEVWVGLTVILAAIFAVVQIIQDVRGLL